MSTVPDDAGCDCAHRFLVRLGTDGDYDRAKMILNRARYPAFVGRSTVARYTPQGGLIFYQLDGVDVAVTLVKPSTSTWMAVGVLPEHQGHGLGGAILNYLRPNFARVMEQRVPWFEKHGYHTLGDPKPGRRWNTHVMVRDGLFELAGRVSATIGDQCRCCEGGEHHA